jgi:hypothetical protein
MESRCQTGCTGLGVGLGVLVGANVLVEGGNNSVVVVLVVDRLERESMLPLENQNIVSATAVTTSASTLPSIQIRELLGFEVMEGEAGTEWTA